MKTMELKVASHKNIPEGSILSIRCGSIRQQVPLSSDRSFTFPAIAGSMKVDILQPLATGHISIDPEGASKDTTYGVVFHDNANMNCHIRFQALSENETPPSHMVTASDNAGISPQPPSHPKSGGRPSRAPSQLSSAAHALDGYIKKHELYEKIGTVLKQISRDKPEDPFAVMSALFSSYAYNTWGESNHEGQAKLPKVQPREEQPTEEQRKEEHPTKGSSTGTSDSRSETAANKAWAQHEAVQTRSMEEAENEFKSPSQTIQTGHHNSGSPVKERQAVHQASSQEASSETLQKRRVANWVLPTNEGSGAVSASWLERQRIQMVDIRLRPESLESFFAELKAYR